MSKKFFTSAIVVAAGAGKRFNSDIPKQFLKLKGKIILAYSIEKLERSNLIDEIIIIVPKRFINYCQKNIVIKYNLRKVSQIISGGLTRQSSVQNGLLKVNKKCNLVLVHDGVRPLIDLKQIEAVIKSAQKTKVTILGVPVKETVKIVNNNVVVRTEEREKFYLAQTPQAFERNLFLKAFEKAKKDKFLGTDCSSLVERLGVKVRIIEGSERNIKITSREDFQLAEKILEMKSSKIHNRFNRLSG